MSKKVLVHCALFIVALIYAATFTIAKEVMPAYVPPFALIVMRVWGATALLWITHALFIKDKITDKKDFKTLAICAVFGVGANMLLFFKGLSLTTPINGAIIMVMTPLFVSIFAYLVLKETFSIKRISGLVLGLSGAVLLLLNSAGGGTISGFTGDIMIMLNAIIYSYYLIISKPLLHKYMPLTVIKWSFLFGAILVFPFGAAELMDVNWTSIPAHIWGAIAFLIIGATYFTYLLNGWALRYVNSSVVGAYIYLQPVLASLIAVGLGKDQLSMAKICYSLMIFTGVYLVSFSNQFSFRKLLADIRGQESK